MAALGTPGVYIERVALPPEPVARLSSVAGFVGLASRGPLNLPQRIRKWDEFEIIFGSENDRYYLPGAVKSFFANGGQLCYVVRVAHSVDSDGAPRAARYRVRNTSGQPLFDIDASGVGSFGDDLEFLLTASSRLMTLTQTAPIQSGVDLLTVDSSADLYDGMSVQLHPLNQGVSALSTIDEVISETRIRLTEAVTNDWPSGCNVVGRGLSLTVKLGSIEERFGALSLNPEHPSYLLAVINGDPSESSWIANGEKGHSTLIRIVNPTSLRRPISGVDLTLSLLPSIVAVQTGLDPVIPMASAYYTGYDDSGYFPYPNPALNGYQGVAALEQIEQISLVAVPDLCQMIQKASSGALFDFPAYVSAQHRILDHCEKMGDRMAILDPPPLDGDPVAVIDAIMDLYVPSLAINSTGMNGALYFPWIRRKEVTAHWPPSGTVAGVFANTDALEGVQRAPANIAMTDVIALQLALDSSATEQLTALGVNCLKSMPSLGPAVWGARTLSNNSVYRYISARRTVLSVKRALRRTLAWAVFEPNTPELKKTIVGSVTAYLNGLFRSGVLAGTKPEEAFVVQAENMDDNLIIDIGLALLIPTEFVVIRLRHTNETIEVYS